MAHHGAVCFGRDYEETFACAKELEEACFRYITKEYCNRSKDVTFEEEKLYQYYVTENTQQKLALPKKPFVTSKSYRTQNGFLYEGMDTKEYRLSDPMPQDAQLHRRIYECRPDIHFIDRDFDLALVALSLTGRKLKPLLDDFAQLVGTDARCARSLEVNAVEAALRGRYGVLLPGEGAICCASSESDLQAVHIVMEKNAKTQIGAWLFGGGQALSRIDCILMNLVYKKSYSKKAEKDRT